MRGSFSPSPAQGKKGIWAQFMISLNKQRQQQYLERYFRLRKEITFSQDFVTSSCPEMPKMFPQMCPGLWYLRNLITSPDYVKSGQTLTCLIKMTRDSQPICTFLPRSPPLLCYLCIWILMARVSSVVIWVSSGGPWYITDIRLIRIKSKLRTILIWWLGLS